MGRIEVEAITDDEALAAFSPVRAAGGHPAGARAQPRAGQVTKLAPTLARDQIIVMNLCGRGDKDVFTVGKATGGRAVSGRIEARFAELRGEGRAGLVTFLTAGDPDSATSLQLICGPARGRGRPDRDRHAVHRPDGRRAGDPGGEPARACGRHADGPHAGPRPRVPGATTPTPDRADGLLQPDLRLRQRALPRGCQGRRGRRADRRRPAAGGGRRAVPAGARSRARLHPPRHARPPTTGACRPCCENISRLSSTMSRSPASPARRRPWPSGGARGRRASSATPTCRWRWASASASPSRRPRSPASPMPSWWARPWSSWSPSTSTTPAGRAGAGAGRARQGARRWPRPCGVPRR